MNAFESESDCLQALITSVGISLFDVEELGSISLIASMISSSLKSNELKVDDILNTFCFLLIYGIELVSVR